jgi:hypothetical protein
MTRVGAPGSGAAARLIGSGARSGAEVDEVGAAGVVYGAGGPSVAFLRIVASLAEAGPVVGRRGTGFSV